MSRKKILIDMKMIDMGIAPESSGHKLNKMLMSLSPEERRRVKRKFRKIWKKMCKEDPEISESVGLGTRKPTDNHKRNRRAWVRRKVSQKILQE